MFQLRGRSEQEKLVKGFFTDSQEKLAYISEERGFHHTVLG